MIAVRIQHLPYVCARYYCIGIWALRDDNLAGNVDLLALWLRLTSSQVDFRGFLRSTSSPGYNKGRSVPKFSH